MNDPSISVFIIALNEENNLGRCLRSVSWADEIVLVDSGSTDKTIEMAREYTDKVFSRKFTNYADQKNFALSLTAGPWCLSLDADEEVTPELRDEIILAVKNPGSTSGYFIPRQSYIFGRKFYFTGTQHDRPMRLFKKTEAVFEQPVHETVKISGTTASLKNFLNHYTYKGLSDYMERLNRYTSLEADFLVQTGRATKGLDISLKSILMFFRLFVMKQGFRDGLEGFIFSVLSGYYVFIKHAKHLEKLGCFRV